MTPDNMCQKWYKHVNDLYYLYVIDKQYNLYNGVHYNCKVFYSDTFLPASITPFSLTLKELREVYIELSEAESIMIQLAVL
jgi:hypothetical protein